MRLAARVLLVFSVGLVVAVGAGAAVEEGTAPAVTVVSIEGTEFQINGKPTYPGTAAQGLLLNARTVQAVFDDENPATVQRWAYSDTGVWDPDRNTNEFIAALPTLANAGLTAVTVGMQGGSPGSSSTKPDLSGAGQDPIVSAFLADGSLKPAWLDRLDRVIRAADENGMIVILNLFYFGQTHRWASEDAVIAALDNTVDWLVAQEYRNVILDVANESPGPGSAYYAEQPILKRTRIATLVERAKTRSEGTLLVSSSLSPGALPPADLLTASDFVLLHANKRTPAELTKMVDQLRKSAAFAADPKPIVINEDSPRLANMDAAVKAGAGWGFHQKSSLQVPPVAWDQPSSELRAFLDRVRSFRPRIVAVPAAVSFAVEPGSPAVTQAVDVDVSSGDPATVTISTDQTWLTASAPEPGETPLSITVSADPVGLEPGVYRGNVTVAADGVSEAVLPVLLLVAAPPAPDGANIVFSLSGARTDPEPLAGATVAGSIYVFIPDVPAVREVTFGLDGRVQSREKRPPWDFVGTNDDRRRSAKPLDTRKLRRGLHTVSATVGLRDGTKRTVSADFVVEN
jgi:Cellulase (glycosyl hydrolase family 5)